MVPPPCFLKNPSPARYPITRSSGARAHCLTEPTPNLEGVPGDADWVASYLALVDWFNVEKSWRYQVWDRVEDGRRKVSTFCNVLATDVMKAVYDALGGRGPYLPHTYWTPLGLKMIERGEKPEPRTSLGTCRELSANGLFNWLVDDGELYGWQLTQDPEEAQRTVLRGGYGVAIAEKRGGIGHVSVLLPGVVDKVPLQAQAGAKNYNQFRRAWWTGKGVTAWTFALYVPPPDPASLISRALSAVSSLFR